MPLNTPQPCFENGFYAPGRGGLARYPQLWDRAQHCYAPCLGNTGATLRDWSTRKRHSTLVNSTAIAGWARSFGIWTYVADGSDNYTTCAISSMSYLSVSCWVRPLDTPFARGVVSSSDPSLGFSGHWYLGTGTSNSRWAIRFNDGASVKQAQSSVDYTLSAWQHIGAVYDRSTIRLFINGILAATTSVSAVNVNSYGTLLIGAINEFSGSINAHIDDVRIYDRPITIGEMKLLARRRGAAYELDRTKTRYGYDPGPESVTFANQLTLLGVS